METVKMCMSRYLLSLYIFSFIYLHIRCVLCDNIMQLQKHFSNYALPLFQRSSKDVIQFREVILKHLPSVGMYEK